MVKSAEVEANGAVAWSFVMFSRLAKKAILSWMDRLSLLATVRRQTILTPTGPTSKARFSVRFFDRTNRGGVRHVSAMVSCRKP